MGGFNWLDYVILVVISLSALVSLTRGFVREALSLASWGIAFLIALKFSEPLSIYLSAYIRSPTFRIPAAFGALLVVVLIIGGIINRLICSLVAKTGLGSTDRVLGIFFGAGRGVILVAALLLMLQLTPMPKEALWQESLLVPYFSPVENWLRGFLPDSFDSHFQLSVN